MNFGICGSSWNQSLSNTEGQLKFWESQKLYTDFNCAGVSAPNFTVVQGQLHFFFFFYNELSWEIESATLMVYLLAIISTTESKRKNQNNEPTTINQPIKSRQNQARIISSVNETLFGSLNSSCSIWQVTYVLCVLISVYVKLG